MATANESSVSFISLLLSLILPFTMIAAVADIDAQELFVPVDVQLESTLTVAQETVEVTAALKNAPEEGLRASAHLALNGEKQGLVFENGQILVQSGEETLSLDVLSSLMDSGRITLQDYQDMLMLEKVLAYASDGRFQTDLNVLLPWLQLRKPELNKLFSVESTVLQDGNTRVAFTFRTRDLPAALVNMLLRTLSSHYNREMINSLHLWELMDAAPENPAAYLMKTVTGSGLMLSGADAIEAPVEIIIAPDGTIVRASAEAEFGAQSSRKGVKISYEEGRLHIVEQRFDYGELSVQLELNAFANEAGGMLDWNAQNEGENVHFFANWRMDGDELASIDAQYVSSIFDCTCSFMWRPQRMNITYYTEDGESLTADINCYPAGKGWLYWADVIQLDLYDGVDRMIKVSGNLIQEGDGFDHVFTVSGGTLENDNAWNGRFEQRVAADYYAISHNIAGTLQSGAETLPIEWKTTLTFE